MLASLRPLSASSKGRVQRTCLLSHNIPHRPRCFVSAPLMFLNYLTISIPLVMFPLYVQQQLHLSDLLIGIAVGSQFIATFLIQGAAGRVISTSSS